MERVGKIFKLKVEDRDGVRTVEGYVRSKNLKNIVKSIDFLQCVTDKLGSADRAEEAVSKFKELDMVEKADWGLFYEFEGDMTHLMYCFRIGTSETGTNVEIKEKESEEIASGQAEGPALDVSTDKGEEEPEPKPAPKKKSARRFRVENFLRWQAEKIKTMMWVYYPKQAAVKYGTCVA